MSKKEEILAVIKSVFGLYEEETKTTEVNKFADQSQDSGSISGDTQEPTQSDAPKEDNPASDNATQDVVKDGDADTKDIDQKISDLSAKVDALAQAIAELIKDSTSVSEFSEVKEELNKVKEELKKPAKTNFTASDFNKNEKASEIRKQLKASIL